MDNKTSEHSLKLRRPNHEWDVFVNICIEADQIIRAIEEKYGALPHYLSIVIHGISWHRGLHTARWICENKDLVRRYAEYEMMTEAEREDLDVEVDISIRKLSR